MVSAAQNTSTKQDFKTKIRSSLMQGSLPSSATPGAPSDAAVSPSVPPQPTVPSVTSTPTPTPTGVVPSDTPVADQKVPDISEDETLDILNQAITETQNMPVNVQTPTSGAPSLQDYSQNLGVDGASMGQPISSPIQPIQNPLTGQVDTSLGQVAQSMPHVQVPQVPVSGGMAGKERAQGSAMEIVTEAGAGSAQVEFEPNPEQEVPVEVDAYLQKVEDHSEQLPQEIAIADNGEDIVVSAPKTKKVVMVPVTPEVEKEGKKKPTSTSVRWLVEWSQKVMKMFKGDVVYWQDEN